MPSYKEDLESLMDVPGAEFLFLRPRCHPEAALTVAYARTQGAVVVACAACNFGVADILVASRGAGLNNLLPKITSEPGPPVLPKPRGRGKPKLELVGATPNHTQDQRQNAKSNRRRRK